MERIFVSFPIADLSRAREQCLSWADSRFDICSFLDNHEYDLRGHSVECLLAAGAVDHVEAAAGGALTELARFTAEHRDWLFGHFGYGLTRETEPVGGAGSGEGGAERGGDAGSVSDDPIGFADLFFFRPEYVVELGWGEMRIGSLKADHEEIFAEIMSDAARMRGRIEGNAESRVGTRGAGAEASGSVVPLQARFTREEYIATVERLQRHILRGDFYEINFCQEFFASPAEIDPVPTWFALSRNSPSPFAAYYKVGDSHLLCASPERYLKRTGATLISQPIKGTAPRGKGAEKRETGGKPESREDGRGRAGDAEVRGDAQGDARADEIGRERLYHSSKDRSENVMVVDLVRNDLSRVCEEGSVEVDELYGIYTFPQVHQMISTVRGRLLPGMGIADCIRASFPMGSMTGAPKNRVVRMIAETERTPRGIFSGAVGYITPDGDFDLNVVIRSILYNRRDRYLAYQVGSGITFYSDPALEYEECLLKAEGMRMALGL